MSLIETKNLCQKYDGTDILRNINLKIERGEVFALIGPTGAGKTTLLRLINLIDVPASGQIYFDGTDTAASAKVRLEIRRRMAFVHQKPAVFNTSIFDNIAYGLRWRGIAASIIDKKVSNVLELTGLGTDRHRPARTLSGGEVQRVAIARAIAVEPEVLLLDEPTANLDPLSASKVEELITDIIKRHVTTIIMATHDMTQGQRLADRIAVLMNGEILQMGKSTEIFTSPRNKQVAEFVGVENVIDGVIVTAEDKIINIDVKGKVIEAISDYPAGTKVSACIRPEEVMLALTRVSSSARNSFAGPITRMVALGPLTRVEMDCGFPLVALITKRSTQELSLEKGKQIYATFKATGVHVIKRDALAQID